jgi:hypothetical protein
MSDQSNTGLTIQQLSNEQRYGWLLFREYCRQLEAKGGRLSLQFLPLSELVETREFKTFCTVAKMMQDFGIPIDMSSNIWSGYVERVFEEFSANCGIPRPHQLCSPVLLKRYIFDTYTNYSVAPPDTSDADLSNVYMKAVDKSFRSKAVFEFLGLGRYWKDEAK